MMSLFPAEYLLTPISGIGAKYASGRFNKAGSDINVTYLAEHPHTSMLEYRYTTASAQGNGLAAAPSHAVPPVALFAVSFHVRHILDLTDKPSRDAIGISMSELSGHWWLDNQEDEDSSTQILSRLVYDSKRFEGIKYLSARPGSAETIRGMNYDCYAIYPDLIKNDSYMKVEPPQGDLPADTVYSIPRVQD